MIRLASFVSLASIPFLASAQAPGVTAKTILLGQSAAFSGPAAQLGINTLHITDIQWETTGKEYSRTLWRYVFDQADHHHMHIISNPVGH